jgi:putative cell wall-binding protein
MKKIISIFVIAAILSVSTIASFAQSATTAVIGTSSKAAKKEKRKERQPEVSSRTLQQFTADFPGAIIMQSTRTGVMDKVLFTLNGAQTEAYYDVTSSLVGTVTTKTVNDIPAQVLKAIGKDYKGYTIGKVILFDDNEANDTDMILYGQQFADADNYFAELTKNGKRIIVQISPAGSVNFFKTF